MGPVGSQVVGIVQLIGLAQPPGAGSGVDGDSNGADLLAEDAGADVEDDEETHELQHDP